MLLEVDNLTVGFPTDDGVVNAVRGVSYQLHRGESLGIVGESGSGKSVTSLAILGLLPKTAQISGSAKFRGEELIGLTEDQYAKYRGKQDRDDLPGPADLAEPGLHRRLPDLRGDPGAPRHLQEGGPGPGVDLLDKVGIPHPQQRVHNYPHEMSGGMRQRVVIAIAMANDPDVIIADEPTTALDVTVQAQVLEALEAARAETGAAMVLITHDLGVIAGHTDRICVMYAGKLVEKGSIEDVFYRPRMPYTLGLLGSLPRLDEAGRERLTPIVGSAAVAAEPAAGLPVHPAVPAGSGSVRGERAGVGRHATARRTSPPATTRTSSPASPPRTCSSQPPRTWSRSRTWRLSYDEHLRSSRRHAGGAGARIANRWSRSATWSSTSRCSPRA